MSFSIENCMNVLNSLDQTTAFMQHSMESKAKLIVIDIYARIVYVTYHAEEGARRLIDFHR